MVHKDIEQQITQSAERLIQAALREIDRMMRNGATLPDILSALKAFRLPPAESAALERQLQKAMDQIVETRSRVVKELSDAEIEQVKAAAMVSFPTLKHVMKNELIPTVQRVIAAGLGPTALRHLLKEKHYDHTKTLATTALAQFNNQLTLAGAEASGATAFAYFGPISPSTRPFCRAHAGKIFTLDEIDQMDNGQGISVRSSLGGYNCRHYWVVSDERPDEKTIFHIGKKTLMMDAQRQNEFFSHQRTYYVEVHKTHYAKKYDFEVARAIAITHDSLNERITGQPADGLWRQTVHHLTDASGEARVLTNIEYHIRKRKKDRNVETSDDYRIAIRNVLRNGESVVYEAHQPGSVRYLIHDEHTHWLVMVDTYGAIHTAYKLETESPLWKRRKKIGALKTLIGDFPW